jgi:hypothetical protein
LPLLKKLLSRRQKLIGKRAARCELLDDRRPAKIGMHNQRQPAAEVATFLG